MRKTNDILVNVLDLIREAIGYTEADVEHSLESDAKEQAATDQEKVDNLYKALYLVEESFK
jgi:hypothetical protein